MRSQLWLAGLPISLFTAMALLFGLGLKGDPGKIPSPLIGKPVPNFELAPLEATGLPGFSHIDLQKGQITVVNIFASWCVPCRDEHPFLIELAKSGKARLVGINYKDDAANARRFLETLGNPYDAIGVDRIGRAAVDWGVYGVPETFIINGNGQITHKHIGPITQQSLNSDIFPAIEKAKN